MPRNGGAIRAGISTKEDIKAPFLTRFAFIIVNACMISLAAVGVLLTAAGAIYRTSVGDNGLGMILVAIGVLLAITGALGFVSCYKRMLSGMLFTELMLVMIFIILYIAFVVAFLMAVGAQSPVDKGVDSAWNQGMRRDLFEKDTPGDRWCRLNTDLVGPCKRFYNKAGEAVRRSQQGTLSSCNMSVTEMALDCPSAERTCRTSNQPKNIGKFGRECTLCDLECKAAVKTKIKDALDPAVLGNWVLFAILVIDVMLINFLLGETLRMRSHVMFGYALNTLIFVTCMVVVLFLGVVISRMEGGCSASVDCTSWSIAGSFIIVFGLMIISAVAVFGLWSENDLVLRLANFLFILSGFLLLLVAIVLAMASGAISDVNAYYEEHWPDVRDELNHNGYCDDLDCLAHNGTWVRTGEGSYGAPVGKCSLHPVPHPKSPNVEIDPCVSRIEAATEEEAVSICAVASVVVLGMMATIYFNFRGIKQLSKLGDYQDGVMGEITETRAAMMAEQAKVLAERNKLESKINAERAKLEMRLKEMDPGQRNSAKGQKLSKDIKTMGKKKNSSGGKKKKATTANPMHD